MPPKKKDKDDEVDLSTLPSWLHIICAFSLNMKKSRAFKLMEKLRTQPKSFQKTIHRDDIINFAKEKGYYTDLNALTEKQKKDAKFMESIAGTTELSSKILAKSFTQMIFENDVQGRKVISLHFLIIIIFQVKKDKLEGKELPSDKKGGKDEKKAPIPEKKVKKDEKLEEKKEEEKVQQEKEYNKAFDILYILLDYPKTLVFLRYFYIIY